MNDRKTKMFALPANDERKVVFRGLNPASFYELTISANTSKGYGPAVKSTIATKNGGMPYFINYVFNNIMPFTLVKKQV